MGILNSESEKTLRSDTKARVSLLLLKKLKLGTVSKKESKEETRERMFKRNNPLQAIINTHNRRKENNEVRKATIV